MSQNNNDINEIVRKEIQNSLSRTFKHIIKKYGYTADVRLMIVQYTVGYMGATYELHIP